MRIRRTHAHLALGMSVLALGAVAPLAGASENRAPTTIVGGRLASTGEYPWMAALYTLSPSVDQFCGATLVKANYVVTAAHCTPFITPGATKVLLGRNKLNGTGGQSHTVLAVTVHPLYNAGTNENDVAVLRLASNSAQQTLPYARPGQEALWAPGVTATITGWGLTKEDGDPSNDLLEATVPIVSDADCQKAYGTLWINPKVHLCAGNLQQGGVDTCQGDSGGPLMVPNGSSGFILAGVTSWGEGCARKGKPGVYTEVGAVASFIDLVVNS